MDVDVVLSVGTEENVTALGLLPAHMRAAARVDQLAVLAQADAFLTHCGMNSASEAIWCGVPTVLYPQQSEEGAVADRMEELGLGLRLKDESHIREAITTVLTEPSYRERTCAVGETFRTAGGANGQRRKYWTVSDKKSLVFFGKPGIFCNVNYIYKSVMPAFSQASMVSLSHRLA